MILRDLNNKNTYSDADIFWLNLKIVSLNKESKYNFFFFFFFLNYIVLFQVTHYVKGAK